MNDIFDIIGADIERVRQKWLAVLRDTPADTILPAHWSYSRGSLCWHVVIGDDVIESDVDFEITSEAIVVRARSERDEPRILFGLLPVPGNFDTGGIEVRFEARAIDIHVYRVEDGSR